MSIMGNLLTLLGVGIAVAILGLIFWRWIVIRRGLDAYHEAVGLLAREVRTSAPARIVGHPSRCALGGAQAAKRTYSNVSSAVD